MVAVCALGACGKRASDDRVVDHTFARVPVQSRFVEADFITGGGDEFLSMNLETGAATWWHASQQAFDQDSVTDGSGWVSAPVGPGGVTLETIHAAATGEGIYYFAAVDRGKRDVYFGRGSSDAVTWQNVVPGIDSISLARIALDPLGDPWIYFANETSQTIEVLHGVQGGEQFLRGRVAVGRVGVLDAAIDIAGRHYVAWADVGTEPGLRLSVRTEGAWSTAPIWQGQIAELSMSVGAAGAVDLFTQYPRVAWHSAEARGLWYAEQGESGWQSAQVDMRHNIGGSVQMAVDQDGLPWLAYTDRDLLDLGVARRTASGDWRVFNVDQNGATGLWPSIRIGADGTADLLYFRADEPQLVLRTWAGVF